MNILFRVTRIYCDRVRGWQTANRFPSVTERTVFPTASGLAVGPAEWLRLSFYSVGKAARAWYWPPTFMFCRGFERIKVYIRSLTHVLSMVLGEALRVDNFTNFDIHMSVHCNIIPNYSQQDATFLDLFIDMYMSYGWGSPRESFHRQ